MDPGSVVPAREAQTNPFDLPQPCLEPWGGDVEAACIMRDGHLGEHLCMRAVDIAAQYTFAGYRLALE